MTDTDYRSHAALGREDLLLLGQSAELFHAVRSGGMEAAQVQAVFDELDPPKRKKLAFDFGEAVHGLVFEPDKIEARFRIIPDSVLASNGARTGKSWTIFEEHCRAHNQIPVKPGQMAVMRMVANSAKRTLAKLLVPDAIHETPIFWTERVVVDECVYEVENKGKPDYRVVRPEKKAGVIIDLKTCADLGDFRWSIQEYAYWMQAVHYMAAFEAVHGFRPLFYFAAVCKAPPFRCRLVQLDDKTEADARARRNELLQEFVRRRRDNDWTDPEQTGIETVAVQVA